MSKAIIKISCKQIIDANALNVFEKHVWDASYEEFLLKSQVYNIKGQFTTFSQMKANDGRANSLHYKCGFAIGGFVGVLNKQIPGLKEALGKNILFDTHQLELIESDITDKMKHKLAIYYHTDTLTLLEHFGDRLLLAYGNKTEQLLNAQAESVEDCFLLQLQAGVSIVEYTPVLLEKASGSL